ncbi:hypothetical protein L3X38_041946 [Prunus dulcis]|uniref:Uncharacterized protein n=1 Tax=Prunus dulcis TaxID=3755 RepID=A0AAD4YJU8_PRUDU|nr:hypothetical protein L3X38_041946 [Prunus dulcis]
MASNIGPFRKVMSLCIPSLDLMVAVERPSVAILEGVAEVRMETSSIAEAWEGQKVRKRKLPSKVVKTRKSGRGDNSVAGSGGEESEGTAEGGWSVDEHPSTMTQPKLDWLREEYSILSNVRLRAPSREEKLSMPPQGWVTLFANMFKYRVRLPLSPFL